MSETPELPPGAKLLSTDEAVEAVVMGEHPESALGGVMMDGALTSLLRKGVMICARLADGRLAFAPGPRFEEVEPG